MDSRTIERSDLEGKVLSELQRIAASVGLEGHQRLRKADLISAILERAGGGNGRSAQTPGDGGGEATAETPAAAPTVEAITDAAPAAATAGDGAGGGEAEANTETDQATGVGSTTGDASAATTVTDQPTTDGGQGGDGAQQRFDRDRDRDRREGGRWREGRGGDGQQRGGDGQQRGGDGQQRGGDGPQRVGVMERPRGRLSREERRRQREERRQREMEAREEELATAPTRVGILDVLPEGYGFLRTTGYLPGNEDVYVSLSQIRRFALRKGDHVNGQIRMPRDNEKYPALLRIETVNDVDPDTARMRPEFDKLTPLFPDERFRLEHDAKGITERIVDLISPIGKGQRGMVVSPPKAGKTTILKQIAGGILASDPDTHLIILLVDERPEEVTDWQRTVPASEVVYSTFDKPADQHTQVTELVLERAKRLVEQGRDVAILLDSITRLARAYNLSAPASGRILSGGVDSTALYPPKRFFGAARNIEEGGSLTIIASALVETGSRMDEVIFEEFKGTGNMELRLDRSLADKRIFPAINIDASGTRKEERLMGTDELALVWRLRRVLTALDSGAALELLIDKIRATKSNEQFLREISKAPAGD